jgi:hypothetical protein
LETAIESQDDMKAQMQLEMLIPQLENTATDLVNLQYAIAQVFSFIEDLHKDLHQAKEDYEQGKDIKVKVKALAIRCGKGL